MRTAEVALWVAVGLAAVAVVAVSLAGWQLVVARRQAQQMRRLAVKVRDLSSETQNHAGQAAEADESARDQARWAWEQVKLANTQLEQAQQENQASAQAEQWEWAYALTMAARELVDASTELIRIGLDTQVAPHYRQSANRHYRQSCQRWQDTMIKALSRTSPSLEVQHQLIAFGYVHQRLHGHIDVLLRATETGTLSDKDPVTQSVHALRHELANVHRQFQRTISASLAAVGETEIHEAGSADTGDRRIEGAPAADTPLRVAAAPPPGLQDGTGRTANQPTNETAHRTAAQQSGSQQSGSQRTVTRQPGTQQPGTQQPAAQQAPTPVTSGQHGTAQQETPQTGNGQNGVQRNGTPQIAAMRDKEQRNEALRNGSDHTAPAPSHQIGDPTAGAAKRIPDAARDTGPAPQGPPAKARTAQARPA
ncbi:MULTISPECIES: hypothetical protein [Prauserella salsuginis group]|uniref:Uncharacterized protein n=1 Tax=Prauserella salsuginis TaxID=387889 RepID=A0ABW6G3Y2_9PSEU|nr:MULTISPECIES: hypothetical protein [Prauserella salsuginis group]MCR3718366.1 hypothetical protein [Prauserella flava]MCR3732936.1 hypothetical protein [Prauserella salsuginis]